MHLPGPLRAAVGLAVTAADEARHLPDRAIELPMLVVSTALQASLRAQQRYARLAARGDEVLHRRPASEQPPAWATFDDPLPVEQLRGSVFGGDGASPANGRTPSTARALTELFGVEDPHPAQDDPGTEHASASPADPAPESAPEPPAATKRAVAARTSAAAKKTAARKAAATKSAARKSAATKSGTPRRASSAAARSAPAKSARTKPADTPGGKPVNKPRHTAPSAFDSVDDDD